MIKYQDFFETLEGQEKFLFQKIIFHHNKARLRSNRHKIMSVCLKISIFILGAATSIILGLELDDKEAYTRNIAIVIGGLITVFSAVLSYFNLEKFWMANAMNHLKLNQLRDKFIFLHKSENGIKQVDIDKIFNDLNTITQSKLSYWEDVIESTQKKTTTNE